MSQESDARAGGIIAGCLAARTAWRLLDLVAVAWTNSRARQLAVVPSDRARLWTVCALTAAIVVLIFRWLGVAQ